MSDVVSNEPRGRRRPSPWVLAVVVGAFAAGGAAWALTLAGSGRDMSAPVPQRPASAPVCTGREGESVLRSFARDFNAGATNLVATYFAEQKNFVRWWDPTVPPREVVEYSGLTTHLGMLQRAGERLTVASFQEMGYQNGANGGPEGGWFSFDVRAWPGKGAAGRLAHGKGAVDCATGRLKVIVYGWQ
jgi:hypothetical protein